MQRTMQRTMQRLKIIALSLVSSVVLVAPAGAKQTAGSPQKCQTDTGSIYRVDWHQGESHRSNTREFWRKDALNMMLSDDGVGEIVIPAGKGRYSLLKFFDHYQRAIEYQTGEFSGSKVNRVQPLSKELVGQLKVVETRGEGCTLVESRSGEIGSRQYRIEWQPYRARLISAEVKTLRSARPVTISWVLSETVDDPAEINAAFAKRFAYQATDFADIGDNESDPFLRKMINIGFVEHGSSGAYDSSGHQFSGGHQH